jgi:hypothetical protein
MYNASITLIINIFKEFKKLLMLNALNLNNVIIIMIKELIIKIQVYYKVYIIIISSFLFLLNLILLTLFIKLYYF